MSKFKIEKGISREGIRRKDSGGDCSNGIEGNGSTYHLVLHTWKELKLLSVVVVLSLKCLLAGSFRSGNGLHCLPQCLAFSLRTFGPFYACRRFTFRCLAATLRATRGSDSEFSGRLRIKLPCDWQIFSLLKFANARPGSQTGEAIDLPRGSVLCGPQNLLHRLDIVRFPAAGPSLLTLAPE